MSSTATASLRSSRPHYARHFLLTTLLTLVMLCAMTLYYGFRELRNTAHDVAAATLKAAETSKARHASASVIAQQSLASFRDAQQIELCVGGQCSLQLAPDDAHMSVDLLNTLGLPCSTIAGNGDRATVCMSVDDVVEDITRDVIILLISQAIGFGIWVASSRRYATRRRLLNERVNQAATTDAATGLLNRGAFREALDATAARGEEAWLVLVGIDELKSVNELHCSAAGDHVILSVAQRLKGLVEVGALARTGGDEFAFTVRGASPAVLERSLSRLRAAMTAPVEYEGLLLRVSVCAGATLVERHLHASELMRRANVALRAAKKVGADSQSIFNAAFDIELRKTHQLRLDLMTAVDKGQIELVYQPIVDARGQVVMAEALARWRHPVLGSVAPDVFIAAAESSGLIHELGVALLKKACADLVTARSRGLPLKRIAVNVSPEQLNNPDLANIVMAVVHEAGLQPSDIELELTESAAMASRQDATQQLRELADAGFAIAIDDFGTGYSSLSRLQTLPISKLKIDRSFVQACEQPSGAVLLEAMLDLSSRLELSCVAEGIETDEQMSWLRTRGCTLFQGYLIGKPMSLEQLTGMGFRAPLRGPRPSPVPAATQRYAV